MLLSRLRRITVLSCVRSSVIITNNFVTVFAIHYIMKKILNILIISICIGLSTQQDEKNITSSSSCTDYERYDVECFRSKIMELLCNRTYTNVINCENSIINLYDEDEKDEDNITDVLTSRFDVPSKSEFVAHGVLSLGLDIFQKTVSESSAKIQVISPLSISGATSLMQLGARGETLNELRKINGQINKDGKDILTSEDYHENFGLLLQEIKSEKFNTDEHKVTVANGIFAKQKLVIRPEYRNAAVKVYQSHIENLDFENQSESSTKLINKYVNFSDKNIQ